MSQRKDASDDEGDGPRFFTGLTLTGLTLTGLTLTGLTLTGRNESEPLRSAHGRTELQRRIRHLSSPASLDDTLQVVARLRTDIWEGRHAPPRPAR